MVHTIESLFEYLTPNFNNLNFVQIGTNTGDDYFNQLCKRFNPKNVLLVEPHATLNNKIEKNYTGLRYNLINAAIVDDENCQEIQIYSFDNTTQHSSIKPLKDWNKETVTIVPAKTIKQIINDYSLQHINLLYIDTEGFDSFIINYIFQNNLQNLFDSIVFEHWGFENKDYDEENKLHGLQGMKYVEELALNNNFLYADFQAHGDKAGDNHVIFKNKK